MKFDKRSKVLALSVAFLYAIWCLIVLTLSLAAVGLLADVFQKGLGLPEEPLDSLTMIFSLGLAILAFGGWRCSNLRKKFLPKHWCVPKNPSSVLAIVLCLTSSEFIGATLEFLPGYLELYEKYLEMFVDNTDFTMLLGIIAFPIFEEIFFRGILFNGIEKRSSFWPAALISSLFFGFVHLDILQMIDASIGGFIYAWVYYRYRSLWIPIIGHILNNFIAFLVPFNFQQSIGIGWNIAVAICTLTISILIVRRFFPCR